MGIQKVDMSKEDEMLENRIVIDDDLYIENDADEYLEHLYEEDDRMYEDEIFEKLGGNENE